jgi:hypothetical protein
MILTKQTSTILNTDDQHAISGDNNGETKQNGF